MVGWRKAIDVLVQAFQDVEGFQRYDFLYKPPTGVAGAPPPPITTFHLKWASETRTDMPDAVSSHVPIISRICVVTGYNVEETY